MRLTDEQKQLVHAQGRVIVGNAYAGTGKTSTLEARTRAHPAVRTLYLVFNKSVRNEAKARFPRWVKVSTGHGAGYGSAGKVYADKLADSINPWQLAQSGVLSKVPAGAEAIWADAVLRTLQNYLGSPDAEIHPKHVPLGPADWSGPFAWADPVMLVKDTRRLWRRMRDPQDMTIGMLHDGYLKQFVLSQPKLPYDAIMFDEAQDANPVLLQLVGMQTHAQQIYVGDPFQGIYGWRGAVNAMERIRADQTLRLTASFRFGANIADTATRMLRWFDRSLPPLRGLASNPGQVYAGVGEAPVTFLGRSNSRLFGAAVSALDKNPNTQLDWIGGIDGYRLDWLEDTARLWQNEPVKSPFLQLFRDFDTLQDYAETVEDVEWLGRCRAVERWGARLPGLIRRVKAASRDPERATVRLSTIHKAKGLEWPHVVILDDMASLNDDLTPEDQHLWYVAITRATERLGIPEDALARLRRKEGPPSGELVERLGV